MDLPLEVLVAKCRSTDSSTPTKTAPKQRTTIKLAKGELSSDKPVKPPTQKMPKRKEIDPRFGGDVDLKQIATAYQFLDNIRQEDYAHIKKAMKSRLSPTEEKARLRHLFQTMKSEDSLRKKKHIKEEQRKAKEEQKRAKKKEQYSLKEKR